MESIKIELRKEVTIEIEAEIVDEIVRNYITSTMNVAPMQTLPAEPAKRRRKFQAKLGRRKWGETETDTVRKEFNCNAKGDSARRLAKLLNRTPGAITQKTIELNLR